MSQLKRWINPYDFAGDDRSGLNGKSGLRCPCGALLHAPL
jgi:hypothetical protein